MKLNVTLPERAAEIRVSEITFNLDTREVIVYMIADGQPMIRSISFADVNKGQRDLNIIENYLNLPIEKVLKTEIHDKRIFDQPELPPDFGGQEEGFK